jgi:hypothetical protein
MCFRDVSKLLINWSLLIQTSRFWQSNPEFSRKFDILKSKTIACNFTYNREFNAAIGRLSVTMIWRHIVAVLNANTAVALVRHSIYKHSWTQNRLWRNLPYNFIFVDTYSFFFWRSENSVDSYMNASCISARICSKLAKYLSEQKMVLKRHCIKKRNLV